MSLIDFEIEHRSAAAKQGCQPRLEPELAAIVDEYLYGWQRPEEFWPEIAAVVAECAASDDAGRRRQSLYFRLWHGEYYQPNPNPLVRERALAALSAESLQVPASGPSHPVLEMMAAWMLSDCFTTRRQFGPAIRHGRDAYRWAIATGSFEQAAMTLSSLGFVLTVAGYINAGNALVSRAAASWFGMFSHELVSSSKQLRASRQTVTELSDVQDHVRDFGRAAAGYEAVTAAYGPSEEYERAFTLVALARCLAFVGQPDNTDLILDEAAPLLAANPHARFVAKCDRARVAALAARDQHAAALSTCDRATARLVTSATEASRLELLLDGAFAARQADEPHWVLERLSAVAPKDEAEIALADTMVCRELAWAHRRTGDRPLARRFQSLAHQGQRRFVETVELPEIADLAVPAAMHSGRAVQERSVSLQRVERRSLHLAVGAVIHDVRNHLQSLHLLSQTGPGDPVADANLESVVGTIDLTLEELIRDVEADRQFSVGPLRLAETIDHLLATFGAAAKRKRIAMMSSAGSAIVVLADPIALNRIMSNLVSNAIKYSPEGGHLKIIAQPLGERYVDVHVADSGPGVPLDELDQLFCWNGTTTVSPTAGESQHGIGLYSAQRLANLIGATIRVHPKTPSSPSAFTVRLRRSR